MITITTKRRLASGISVIAIAAALSIATPAHAQAELGTIEGHVDGAAAGTQVVATDTHTGQRAVGTVNAKGDYVILGLRPSDYSISVAGKPAQAASLQVGQTVTVDFIEAAATGGAAGGNIVVTGRRTAQPTQAQTVATNITPAQIENLPQNQRNFLSFAALAPGIQLISPGGAQQIQAGAVSPSNVNVLLDGMSFKNPINHGGVFGQNFGLGNPFPQLAVQEYQVQTQNFGAETGQAGSAVLTAITKTGGDKFHGSAFIEWQPKSFITQPKFQTGPKPKYDRKQFGGELGGPIIPGKLTFYVAGEGTIETLPGSVGKLATFTDGSPIFPSNIVSEIVGVPHNFDFKQGLYFGKLTLFATDADTFNAMAFIRRENNLSDIDANAAPTHGRTILTHQDRYQLQWKHAAGNFLNFLNVAYDKGTQATPSVGSGPQFAVNSTFCPDPSCSTWTYSGNPLDPFNRTPQIDTGINPNWAYLGAHFFTQGDKQKAIFLKDDATLRMGDHTLKFGGQLNFLKLNRTVVNFSSPSFLYFNPGPTGTFSETGMQPYAAVISTGASPTVSAKDTQVGLYVSDEWKPDEHWTINAGIRWDFETNQNNKDYVTPAAIAEALRNYPGWKARGIDPEDYISTGHNRDPYWKQFQPRLGVSYDVHGDRDLVIFGGAGRYYDRSLFITGAIETITNANYVVPVIFCPPGQTGTGNGSSAANCATFNPSFLNDADAVRQLALAQGVGGSVWVLPNKIHPPYSDQFDIGVRKRFGDIQASLTYSHVESRHIFMFTRANFFTNGWYSRFLIRDGAGNVVGCTNGGDAWIQDNIDNTTYPGCPAGGGQLAGFPGKLNRGQDNGKARLDALYLQIEKPFTDRSTWGFTQSFTLQRARSNVAQELNSDEFYNGTDFGVYGWNRVNGVEKWRSVTSGIWRAPYGFILSGTLTLSSGPAFGHIVAPWNGAGPFPDPQGSVIFGNLGGVYFPKQDIGYKRLDVRVAKTFKMPWGHEATVDFEAFNVFNWLNRDYSSWTSGGGDNPPRTENSQRANDGRQFQVGLRYKF